MKVVAAIDSMKGSLSSMQAGMAAKDGVCRVYPDAQVVVRPVADGGEGTVEALVTGLGGNFHSVTVTGPLGAPVSAVYGILPDGETAVMEMSAAAGITLVPKAALSPDDATTFGVGEMMLDALSRGCRRILLGIGGSATNDGGIGMLQALGFGMLDDNGEEVPRGGKGLFSLARMTRDKVTPLLDGCDIRVACDVTNPLCGENGCSAVYGPQKGLAADRIADYDAALAQYAALSGADASLAGAGAAGGMGFATATFLHATLESGITMVLREIGLEEEIGDAQLVITGEGRLDAQSAMGKAPAGVAALAKKHKKTVLAFAGGVTQEAAACHAAGIDAMFPTVRGVCTLEDAMNEQTAYENLADSVEQVMRLWKAARG